MNIKIYFIPHAAQRYDTWGDWFYQDDDLIIRVSNDVPELPTENEQFLVALHELVEAWLCRQRGITQEMVDDFDFSHPYTSLPEGAEIGDLPDCPIRDEHRFAMIVEHMMAHEMGLKGYGTIR